MRRFLIAVLALALFTGLFSQAAAINVPPLEIALVIAGELGDHSYYDSAKAGLDKLIEDYGVITTVYECKNDILAFSNQMTIAVQNSDVVVPVGWELMEPVIGLVQQHPDTKFIYVDSVLEVFSNVATIIYAQNEGSFLVGYVAGKLTKTNIIGAIGGEESDTINDFIVGYEAGAKYANPDVEVMVAYTNDYENPAAGLASALELYGSGCDILFQVAGKTGEGVFQAAAETGNYAIGVDSDQKYIDPDVIICSMKKEIGKSIYDTIAKYIDTGEFPGGTSLLCEMESGFVGIGYGEEGMVQQVSPELKAEVEAVKAKIISGEIIVPTELE